MYTNVDTDHAMEVIANFLQMSPLCTGVPHAAIITSLKFLMRNNYFRFGDTFWYQCQGTTMGTPPAPPYATLYVGKHKLKATPSFAPSLTSNSQHTDDVLGLWIHDANPAINRQNNLASEASINSFGKLTWEFMPLQKEIINMDLTLYVSPQGIQNWLFEKKLNLYLYIPPHLTHAPGILRGLIFGIMEHIFCLTSHWRDKQSGQRNKPLSLSPPLQMWLYYSPTTPTF
jgi:hypothetical protein